MAFLFLVLAERNQKLYTSSILLSSTGFHLSRVCLNRRRWNLEEIKSRGQRSFIEEIVKKLRRDNIEEKGIYALRERVWETLVEFWEHLCGSVLLHVNNVFFFFGLVSSVMLCRVSWV